MRYKPFLFFNVVIVVLEKNITFATVLYAQGIAQAKQRLILSQQIY
jgi:hypothetical protein